MDIKYPDNFEYEGYILATGEHLIKRVIDFLSTHPKTLDETCKFCDEIRTCAEGVQMSAEQHRKALAAFLKNKESKNEHHSIKRL